MEIGARASGTVLGLYSAAIDESCDWSAPLKAHFVLHFFKADANAHSGNAPSVPEFKAVDKFLTLISDPKRIDLDSEECLVSC